MPDQPSPSGPMWTPSPQRAAATLLARFREGIAARIGRPLADYDALYAWTLADPEAFWAAMWEFGGIRGDRGDRILVDRDRMPGARFFPDARLNFAENLLRRTGDGVALRFKTEDREERRLSWDELADRTARLADLLRAEGVGVGDRVAGLMPNMPEAVIGMLATASLGATWSSASPDFGAQGVVDRFGQIEPKVLITADGYLYGGRRFDIRPKVAEIAARLPTVGRILVVGHLEAAPDLAGIPAAVGFDEALADRPGGRPAFTRVPFDQPLYIVFSSGTTGVPKCIVHGVGGTLIQHLKEHMLHSDTRPGDRVFYFTTCGWMMWNWLVSALACEAEILLYDGSPFHPGPEVLFDWADRTGMTFFGTSAKYIDAVAKSGLRPVETHDLSTVRAIASTGSPLVPESFDFVYSSVKRDVQLASISGGTDILSCFALGDPTGPVWRGELQKRGLGLAVEVFDEDGRPVAGQKGELVCTAPFPAMPVGFFDDPDGSRYRAAYFERFPGVWCHGDYVELTAHGGLVIYGRSDATLNPGGVRIGTAEIYRQVEALPEVLESIVVAQDWEGDVRIVLFVRLRDGAVLDADLEARIRTRIRTGASPRHVPARIVAVADIPRTKSGKIVELAVRDVIHGRPIRNREALANPDALDLYRDLPQLRT